MHSEIAAKRLLLLAGCVRDFFGFGALVLRVVVVVLPWLCFLSLRLFLLSLVSQMTAEWFFVSGFCERFFFSWSFSSTVDVFVGDSAIKSLSSRNTLLFDFDLPASEGDDHRFGFVIHRNSGIYAKWVDVV